MLKDKHVAEAESWLRNGDFEASEGGVLIHRSILWKGVFTHSVNGEDEQSDSNLITTEGINHLLDVGLSGATAYGTWYLAPFTGATTPAASHVYSTFNTDFTEMTDGPEGYSQANRVQWEEAGPSAGVISNLSTRASFTIVTASSISITGAGLVNVATKNDEVDASGVLLSATKFGSARSVNNADTFELGYSITLTDT